MCVCVCACVCVWVGVCLSCVCVWGDLLPQDYGLTIMFSTMHTLMPSHRNTFVLDANSLETSILGWNIGSFAVEFH